MKKVSTFVLRDKLATYLNEVVETETPIIIHKYGKPIAKIVPYSDEDTKKLHKDLDYFYGFLPDDGEDGVAFENRVRRNKIEREYVKKLRKGKK